MSATFRMAPKGRDDAKLDLAPAEVARVRFFLLYKENPALQGAWRPCVAGFAFYSGENLETERAEVARVKFADYRERLGNEIDVDPIFPFRYNADAL